MLIPSEPLAIGGEIWLLQFKGWDIGIDIDIGVGRQWSSG